jgi:hypothetical protein
MQSVKEKIKYVIKPRHLEKQAEASGNLLAEWRVLAEKIGAAWQGGSAVDEIRSQRTKDYDSNHR